MTRMSLGSLLPVLLGAVVSAGNYMRGKLYALQKEMAHWVVSLLLFAKVYRAPLLVSRSHLESEKFTYGLIDIHRESDPVQ